jgi:hypothetical protein
LRLVLCKQLKYYLSYTVFTVHWEASKNKNVLVYVYINTIFVGPAPRCSSDLMVMTLNYYF